MDEKDQNKWVDGYDFLIVYGWYIPKFWLPHNDLSAKKVIKI